MFSSNMLTSTLALASAFPLVFAGALLPQAQDAPTTITRRETTWEAYHQTNAIFAEQGLCRYYIDATDRDGLWPCRQFCASDSVTCTGDNAVTATNPNGERYYYGKCSCSNPILETIVDFTAEGLQGLPGITCAVWLEALKQSVEIGTWFIPGAGPAAGRTRGVPLAAPGGQPGAGREDPAPYGGAVERPGSDARRPPRAAARPRPGRPSLGLSGRDRRPRRRRRGPERRA